MFGGGRGLAGQSRGGADTPQETGPAGSKRNGIGRISRRFWGEFTGVEVPRRA